MRYVLNLGAGYNLHISQISKLIIFALSPSNNEDAEWITSAVKRLRAMN